MNINLLCEKNIKLHVTWANKYVNLPDRIMLIWLQELYGRYDGIRQHCLAVRHVIVEFTQTNQESKVSLIWQSDCLQPVGEWVSLITGLEYGTERWNGKWNGTVNWRCSV